MMLLLYEGNVGGLKLSCVNFKGNARRAEQNTSLIFDLTYDTTSITPAQIIAMINSQAFIEKMKTFSPAGSLLNASVSAETTVIVDSPNNNSDSYSSSITTIIAASTSACVFIISLIIYIFVRATRRLKKALLIPVTQQSNQIMMTGVDTQLFAKVPDSISKKGASDSDNALASNTSLTDGTDYRAATGLSPPPHLQCSAYPFTMFHLPIYNASSFTMHLSLFTMHHLPI